MDFTPTQAVTISIGPHDNAHRPTNRPRHAQCGSASSWLGKRIALTEEACRTAKVPLSGRRTQPFDCRGPGQRQPKDAGPVCAVPTFSTRGPRPTPTSAGQNRSPTPVANRSRGFTVPSVGPMTLKTSPTTGIAQWPAGVPETRRADRVTSVMSGCPVRMAECGTDVVLATAR